MPALEPFDVTLFIPLAADADPGDRTHPMYGGTLDGRPLRLAWGSWRMAFPDGTPLAEYVFPVARDWRPCPPEWTAIESATDWLHCCRLPVRELIVETASLDVYSRLIAEPADEDLAEWCRDRNVTIGAAYLADESRVGATVAP